MDHLPLRDVNVFSRAGREPGVEEMAHLSQLPCPDFPSSSACGPFVLFQSGTKKALLFECLNI